MKKLLFGLVAVPFLVGVASAADRLTDLQMDQVSAGAPGGLNITVNTTSSPPDCPDCITVTTSSTSKDGVTTTTTTTSGPPTSGPPASGSTGGGPLSGFPLPVNTPFTITVTTAIHPPS
jgi:hypothetical protein